MSVSCPSYHSHDHRFGQDHRRPQEQRMFWVTILTLAVMGIEIAAGLLFGSMALLADGVHMGTHALALGLAAFAYFYARKHAQDRRFSFGTGKVGELAGFSSALLLSASAIILAVESVDRLFHPRTIAFGETLVVAISGLVVNLLSALLLGAHPHHDHDHEDNNNLDHQHEHGHDDNNLRAALTHVLADALTSIAAIVAIAAAWKLGWSWLDPVVAMGASVVILIWGIGLLRATGRILLDAEAPGADRDKIRILLESDGDTRVTDLHLWSVGPGAWTLVASVVTHGASEPETYKQLLPLDIYHPIIEVIHCDHCQAPTRS